MNQKHILDKNPNTVGPGIDGLIQMADHLRDAVVIVDAKGIVNFVNQSAARLTGYKPHEMIGKHVVTLIKLTDVGTGNAVADPLAAFLQKANQEFDHTRLFVLTAKNGNRYTVKDQGSSIRRRQDKRSGAILIFGDIHRERPTETPQARQLHLEAVGNLAGGIAHDFNNVLTSILGYLSLAQMAKDDRDKLWSRLQHAESAALRARDLSRQLLTFAKGGDPIRQPSDLKPLIEGATTLALHDTVAGCRFHIDENLNQADVDHAQFSQAIRNLVAFAGDNMPEGGSVEVAAGNLMVNGNEFRDLRRGSYVLITIRDFGRGLPPRDLERIFEPYFATRKTGCGLGLATAYSIIKRHQGHIRAESVLDRGTTFKIFLPVSKSDGIRRENRPQEITHHGTGRILVMDDEADVRLVVTDMLEVMGYDVETSPEGNHAVQLYLTAKRIGNPFAAVIMDLTIPSGMGGKEAVQKLRAVDPGAKVLVSSGYSYDPVMAHHREFGFDGVVPKPYKPDELARVLSQVLIRKDPCHLGHY